MPRRLSDPDMGIQRPWMTPKPGMYALNGAYIARLRRWLMLRQLEVSQKLRVSLPIVSGIENNDYLVNQHLAEHLAHILLGDEARWRELLAEIQPEERSA